MLYRKRVTSSASLDRLTDLIEARLDPDADKDTIDQRITDLFQETWRARRPPGRDRNSYRVNYQVSKE